jgi:hypothetical protein
MPTATDETKLQNDTSSDTTQAQTKADTATQSQTNTKQSLAQERQTGQDAFDEAFAKPAKETKADKGAKVEGKGLKKEKQSADKVESKKENKDIKDTSADSNADDTEGKEKHKEAKVQTAQEKLEARANQLDGGDTKKTETKTTEQKTESTAKDTKVVAEKAVERKPFELTPESMKTFRDSIASGKVKMGDADVDLKQFFTDYPDEFNVITATAMQAGKQMAEEAVSKIMESMVKASDIQDIRNEIAHRSFMEEVMRSHADVHDVIKSDGFKAFMEKQPKGVQKMANSSDPADAKFILDAYKESIGKANSVKKTQEAKEAKERKDALLDDTDTSSGSDRKKNTTQDNKNDFNAGWDETED